MDGPGTDFWTLYFNPGLDRQMIVDNPSVDGRSYKAKWPEGASREVFPTNKVREFFPRLSYPSRINFIFGGCGDNISSAYDKV